MAHYVCDFNGQGVQQSQRRWKSLRSCYNRERTRQRSQKSGSDISFHKVYLYFSNMSFLDSIHRGYKEELHKTNTSHGFQNKDPKVNIELTPIDDCGSQKAVDDAGKKKGNEIINDHDLNFLHLLRPHFKKVPDELKLDLQSEILEILKTYVNNNRSNSSKISYKYENQSNNSTAAAESESEYNFEEE